jgi:Cu+-exporting ATPase
MGIRTVLISGDNASAANQVGKLLGIDAVFANVLPSKKAELIAQLQASEQNKTHAVAMIGDGMNDAPALAQADVGMAMSTGTDVAIASAGITLMRGDLALVAMAIDISKRTWNKIRQNLFWAFLFNTAGIPLAAFGYLSPMVSGSAMALSSFLVLSNALLLKKWRP